MARNWEAWTRVVSAYDKAHCEMTQRNAAKLTELMLVKTIPELESIAFDRDEPAIVRGTAYSVSKACKRGHYDIIEKLLNRVVGKPVERIEIQGGGSTQRAKSFEEFCERAGYPMPFLKQVEMMRFGIFRKAARMILGSRGYGKTDFVVILGTAYTLTLDFWESIDKARAPEMSVLLVTKSDQRNAAILSEIANAAAANGVSFDKQSASALRVVGLKGKDHSVSAVTIGSSSLRGRHPKKIIMDDPVTEEDISEATRRRVQRVYNELSKLTPDILIIGQPVHKFDLYETLRPLDAIEKMEVPHGAIPELDHDLEAMALAGVSSESISASYHLKVISEAGNPFENCKYIPRFEPGSCVAFIDPSFEGGDFTAMSVVKSYFSGVQVYGKVWRRDWFNCVDDFQKVITEKGVQKLCFETNSLGEQPVVLLRDVLDGCGVVGRKSTGPKHSRILAAGAFAELIHLAKDSDQAYISQIVKYEYKAEHDDAPDSLASCLSWIGLIRGKE